MSQVAQVAYAAPGTSGTNVFIGMMSALMTSCNADRTPNFDALVKKGREMITAGMLSDAQRNYCEQQHTFFRAWFADWLKQRGIIAKCM